MHIEDEEIVLKAENHLIELMKLGQLKSEIFEEYNEFKTLVAGGKSIELIPPKITDLIYIKAIENLESKGIIKFINGLTRLQQGRRVTAKIYILTEMESEPFEKMDY